MTQQGSLLPSFSQAPRLLLMCLALLAIACQPKDKKTDPGGNPSLPILFVSVPPQAFLVKAIAGPEFEVRTLINPGQDPHHWLPSPKQILTLGKATAWWPAGLPFEYNLLPKIRTSHSTLQIFPPTNAHDHDHHQSDPHTWLSPPLLIEESRRIADNLSQMNPDKATLYQSRALELGKKIATLHKELEQQLAPYQGRTFLIFHNALEHFAHSYQLTQKVIQSGDASPDPKRLLQIIKQAQQDQITLLFSQPQFDSRSADMVAEAIGGQVVSLDPLSEDVLANLKYIADTLTSSFSQTDP